MDRNSKTELQMCTRCENVFLYSGIGKCICPKCKEEEEEQYTIVKNYIYSHYAATIMDTSKEAGVRASKIKSFIREGRLIIPEGSMAYLSCEVCNTKIKFGRICPECANTISGELKKEMGIDEYSVGEKPKSPNLVSAKTFNK